MVAELDAGLSHWADLLAGGEANARERGDGAAGGAIFWLPTQDSGKPALFHKRANDMRTLESVLL